MDIIIISDVHGDVENLLAYLDKIKELKFDAVVCPGDFTDVNTPKGFSQEDIVKLIIEGLKTLKAPVMAVPGNVDPQDTIKILEKEGVSIHGHGKIVDKFGFYGYGGAKTPFGTNIEPTEEELKMGLQNAYKDVEKATFKIQVTHAPPNGTVIDMIQSGIHVGSNTVKSFIENHHPVLAVSAHIHEARGTDKLRDTFLINSGRFPEGYFGLVKINNGLADGRILNITE